MAAAPGGAGEEPPDAPEGIPKPPADRRQPRTPPNPQTPPPAHIDYPTISKAARRRKDGLGDRLRAGERSGDVLDVLRHRALLQRHQDLVHFPVFMQQQIGQLKRGQADLRKALSSYEEDQLYENACLYTPYAMTVRKRKDRLHGHAPGGGLVALRSGLASAPAEEPSLRRKGDPLNIDSVLQVRALKQNLRVSQRALETASVQAASVQAVARVACVQEPLVQAALKQSLRVSQRALEAAQAAQAVEA